jgi:arylsulfatase A-like enzyme/Tfp pilus assembly protein PilF
MRARTCCGVLALAAAVTAASTGCERSGSARGYNLLLVTLDTVRADHLGAYGYRDAETPALDGLAAEGVRFASASSTVPLTLPAHATILSGLLPPHHGLHSNGVGRFPETAPHLAARLKAAGYRTGAFVGAFVLDRRFGLDRGFDRYDDEIDRDPDAVSGFGAERPGAVVVDRALAWLAATGHTGPFFLWVHLYDAHAPYEPPEPYRSRHPGRPYDGEIAAVDAQVARLLEALRTQSLTQRTVVAVLADHGEALGEHGEPTHGLLLYEGTLRVPLLLRAPGVLAPATVTEPVSIADLAPTLAGLLETPLKVDSGAPGGRDLSAPLRRHTPLPPADLYAESEYARTFGWSGLTAVRRGNLKLIVAPRPEVYDLGRDPGERDNLAAQDALRQSLAVGLERLRSHSKAAVAPQAMDAETRERLQSLGYVAPASSATAPTATSEATDPKDRVALFRDFEAANAALVAGRLADAVARLEPLVAADPHNPVFRGALAQAHRRRGDYVKALASYRQAVADAPRDGGAWYDLAVALQEAGQVRDALHALDEVARLEPERADAANARGISLSSLGDAPGALAAFDKACALDPRDARAQNNRGNVLRQLGRLDEAEHAYGAAAQLSRLYADPLNGLGTLEVQRDRPDRAVPYFDAALRLAPGSREIQLNRGIALETIGDLDGAAAAYRSVLEAPRDEPGIERQRRVAAQLAARLSQRRRPGKIGSPARS